MKISDEEVEFLWGLTPEEGADKLLNEYGVSLQLTQPQADVDYNSMLLEALAG